MQYEIHLPADGEHVHVLCAVEHDHGPEHVTGRVTNAAESFNGLTTIVRFDLQADDGRLITGLSTVRHVVLSPDDGRPEQPDPPYDDEAGMPPAAPAPRLLTHAQHAERADRLAGF